MPLHQHPHLPAEVRHSRRRILPRRLLVGTGWARLLARGDRTRLPGTPAYPSGIVEPAYRVLPGPLTVAGPRRTLTGFRAPLRSFLYGDWIVAARRATNKARTLRRSTRRFPKRPRVRPPVRRRAARHIGCGWGSAALPSSPGGRRGRLGAPPRLESALPRTSVEGGRSSPRPCPLQWLSASTPPPGRWRTRARRR